MAKSEPLVHTMTTNSITYLCRRCRSHSHLGEVSVSFGRATDNSPPLISPTWDVVKLEVSVIL